MEPFERSLKLRKSRELCIYGIVRDSLETQEIATCNSPCDEKYSLAFMVNKVHNTFNDFLDGACLPPNSNAVHAAFTAISGECSAPARQYGYF